MLHKQKNSQHNLLIIISIFIIGFAIYSNTFQAQFFYDDYRNILENTSLRNLSNLGQVFQNCSTRFLAYLSFALNYHFNGDNVLAYHVINILIHCLNSVLVYFFIKTLCRTPRLKEDWSCEKSEVLAIITAFIFLTHPLQTQAVTFIVQRIASLAAFFYILSILLYIKSRLSFKPLVYWGAFVANCCAMFTKEISFTLPLMICLSEFMFFNHSKNLKDRFKYLLPFLCTLILIPLFLNQGIHNRQELSGITKEAVSISRPQYMLTQINVIGTYLRLLFIPLGQNVIYDYPITKSLFDAKTLFLLLSIIGILIWAIKNRPRDLLSSFGVLWFFIALSVESSVIPISDVIQEHRLYLPMVGFGLFISVNAVHWLSNQKKVFMIFTCVIAVYSILTFQRNHIWRTKESLLQDVIEKSPNNGIAYSLLATIYMRRHEFLKAKEYFTKAVILSPDPVDYLNLSSIALAENDFDNAIQLTHKALSFKKWNPAPAFNNLGIAYLNKKMMAQAKQAFEASMAKDPSIIEPRLNLADIFLNEQKCSEAINFYKEILNIDPNQQYIKNKIYKLSIECK